MRVTSAKVSGIGARWVAEVLMVCCLAEVSAA